MRIKTFTRIEQVSRNLIKQKRKILYSFFADVEFTSQKKIPEKFKLCHNHEIVIMKFTFLFVKSIANLISGLETTWRLVAQIDRWRHCILADRS